MLKPETRRLHAVDWGAFALRCRTGNQPALPPLRSHWRLICRTKQPAQPGYSIPKRSWLRRLLIVRVHGWQCAWRSLSASRRHTCLACRGSSRKRTTIPAHTSHDTFGRVGGERSFDDPFIKRPAFPVEVTLWNPPARSQAIARPCEPLHCCLSDLCAHGASTGYRSGLAGSGERGAAGGSRDGRSEWRQWRRRPEPRRRQPLGRPVHDDNRAGRRHCLPGRYAWRRRRQGWPGSQR